MSGGITGFLGQQAFQVGGHKVPYGAIAAVAGVAGVVLVLRARSGGGSVVAAGTPPTYDPSQSAGYGNFAPDYSGGLANLSQQLSDLQGQLQTSAVPGTSSAPAALPTVALPGSLFPQVASQSGAFESWLQTNQSRPDISSAIGAGRWSDLQGEYLRETQQYPKNWK